ncbi:MAG: hypothetical protein PVI40_01475 [Chlamydiota bacterium]
MLKSKRTRLLKHIASQSKQDSIVRSIKKGIRSIVCKDALIREGQDLVNSGDDIAMQEITRYKKSEISFLQNYRKSFQDRLDELSLS